MSRVRYPPWRADFSLKICTQAQRAKAPRLHVEDKTNTVQFVSFLRRLYPFGFWVRRRCPMSFARGYPRRLARRLPKIFLRSAVYELSFEHSAWEQARHTCFVFWRFSSGQLHAGAAGSMNFFLLFLPVLIRRLSLEGCSPHMWLPVC